MKPIFILDSFIFVGTYHVATFLFYCNRYYADCKRDAYIIILK